MSHRIAYSLGLLAGTAALGIIAKTCWADPPGSGYSMTYSQLTAGSSRSGSAAYRVEDVIQVQGASNASQGSASYQVTNAVGKESVTVPVEVSEFTVD